MNDTQAAIRLAILTVNVIQNGFQFNKVIQVACRPVTLSLRWEK